MVHEDKAPDCDDSLTGLNSTESEWEVERACAHCIRLEDIGVTRFTFLWSRGILLEQEWYACNPEKIVSCSDRMLISRGLCSVVEAVEMR